MMNREDLRVPITAEEVTAEWLGAAMGVSGVELDDLEQLFLNNAVVSQIFRAYISFNGEPTTVIVKIPSLREDHRRMISEERIYERESATYELLESWQGGFVPRVLADVRDDAGTSALVLEDLGPPFKGEEAGQVSFESAEVALERLAEVHAAFWNDATLRDHEWMRPAETSDLFSEPIEKLAPAWENMLGSGLVEVGTNARRLGDRLKTELGSVMERLNDRPQTLIHADLHQANLMFRHRDSTDPVVIDWGNTASCGSTSDLAKFLATSLKSADLAAHENSLLRTYHDALIEAAGASGPFRPREKSLPWTRSGARMGATPSFRRMPESKGSEPGSGRDASINYPFDQLLTDYRLAQLATLANYVIANFTPGASPDVPETSSPSLRAVLAAVDATGTFP